VTSVLINCGWALPRRSAVILPKSDGAGNDDDNDDTAVSRFCWVG
jgi:hypothetical protein